MKKEFTILLVGLVTGVGIMHLLDTDPVQSVQFDMANNEQFRTLGLDISGNAGLTTTNPDTVARLIIDFMLPKGLLDEPEYAKAYAIFRSDIEEVYYEGGNQESWTLGTWPQAPFQVYLLLQYIARQPEFQLK